VSGVVQYRIDRVADLLEVPAEKRHECIRQLEYALELHEFAYGERAAEVQFVATWTDDGSKDVSLELNGEPLLTLAITDNPP
jgi:CO dehydrogenase/acetyl-CoA synthase delta subunit